jgi:5-methylcytosine-specific restriction endonuclease McrBC GTP-binding regulatory subunit McrB
MVSAMIHPIFYKEPEGERYTKELITNFYLSLKTKTFVILSGISGAGKCKIVELFARTVGTNRHNQSFQLVPVRPDWSIVKYGSVCSIKESIDYNDE